MRKEMNLTLLLEILKRDNYTCIGCGIKDNLEVHHLVPTRFGGNDDPDNLLTLCKICHEAAEPTMSLYEARLLTHPKHKEIYPGGEKGNTGIIKCLQCGLVLESMYTHDFQQCDCPNQAFVDGGTEYTRIGSKYPKLVQVITYVKHP